MEMITYLKGDENIVLPEEPLSITIEKGLETYKLDDNTIGVRMKWISVKDRLPKEDEKVLILVSDGDISIGGWRNKKHKVATNGVFLFHDINPYDSPKLCTHWMPLPQPPKD